MERTYIEDTPNKVGQKIRINGWVNNIRKHGKIIFVDLRDKSGIAQIVFDEKLSDKANILKNEFVLDIIGTVVKRPESMVNTELKTGEIEIQTESFEILNESETTPFEVNKDSFSIDENIRMKYRYVDLRTARMQNNIRLRSKFVQLAREFLFSNGFTEIETPLLTKSTPEGSRDFVVPSRLQPGKFYALPQSPQQYKQLLMVSGFERYFQTARAIRDEDLRADRGFEHTQIDIEMSFIEMNDVMSIVENMVIYVVESLGFTIKEKPFPRITYKDAMEKYGADKFDMRTEEDKKNGLLAYAWVVEFPFFEKTDEGGWTFTHNPFSMPKAEHLEWHMKGLNIENILTTQYDLVCNGYESGGGSVRAHKPEILEATYKIMGYSSEEIQKSIGHMLEAFKYGAPPHGGIALGLERNLMNLTGESYLREVVSFPMTGNGNTSVMNAPSEITPKLLDELGLYTKSSLYEKIRGLLISKNIDYEEYHHHPVRTSEEAAQIRNTPLKEGAKALIMVTENNPVMIVVPGDEKVDTDLIKSKFGFKKLKMSSIEEAEKVSGTQVGGVPPFGNLFEPAIIVYAKDSLFDNEFIVFNAGDRSISIRMSSSDWKKIVEPIVF